MVVVVTVRQILASSSGSCSSSTGIQVSGGTYIQTRAAMGRYAGETQG